MPADRRPTPSHYLRGNKAEWSPRHLIFADTETLPQREGKQELHRMRLWVAARVDRRPPGGGEPVWEWGHGWTRHSMAAWVDGAAGSERTTWLYAHNLGFDLTVSRLPDFLHKTGWRMTDWSFAGRSVTGSMRRGNHGLRLADSVSLLPAGLAQVGAQLGTKKLGMPDWSAPDEVWLTYCERDVQVLGLAVLELMRWWDEGKRGRWAATGPGCGWNAMRHHRPQPHFLIRTDPDEIRGDRAAVYGGRRDVTRVGTIGGGPFVLIDFSNAYLTVARYLPLPTGRLANLTPGGVAEHMEGGSRHGLLAEVTVDTPVPRYPFRTPKGVFYPVGRFTTILAGPELAWARDSGHVVSYGPGVLHRLGMALQPWASWCLELIEAADDQVHPVVKTMVKQWGRSVIGRFASRNASKHDRGPALWPGWHMERGTSGSEHLGAADVHIAGRHWWYVFDQDSENCYPAVLAYVESYVRRLLGEMLEQLGEEMWVCCDTDGAVLDLSKARSWLSGLGYQLGATRSPMLVAEAVCEELRPSTCPLVARPKQWGRTLQVVGPQHYRSESFERAAGRPSRPEVGADGELEVWQWPRVGWQMAEGSPEGFVRVQTQWTEPSRLAHRWVLTDGTAIPVRVQQTEPGTSALLRWDTSWVGGDAGVLDGVQGPALAGLY